MICEYGTGGSDEVVGGGFGDGAAYPFKHGPFVTGQGVVDGAMLGREEHAERRNSLVEACDAR